MTTTLRDSDLQNLELEPVGQDVIETLNEQHSDHSVTLVMPTHRAGKETRQDPIRFKNLVKELREELEESELDTSIADRLESLEHAGSFWEKQGDGLVIFCTPDFCRAFRLTHEPHAHVSCGDKFYLLPVVQEMDSRHRFLALSLSWDEAKLLEVNRHSFDVIETELLPGTFHDLVTPRDPEESLQNRSFSTSGSDGGRQTAMFHGQGEGEDKVEADRMQYLSIVGEEVDRIAYEKKLPVVLAATTEVAGHLQAQSDVEIAAVAQRSPDDGTDNDLVESLRAANRPDHERIQNELDERLGTALAQKQGSVQPDEIAEQAQQGRVDTLIVCPEENMSRIVNDCVVETLRCGGDIAIVDDKTDSMQDSLVAAIYRY